MAAQVPMEGFTFGCDPELFVKNEKGVCVCADMIPGTKEEPFKVKCGAVQRDGMAAEFNIDPASTYEEWENNISTVLAELGKMLPPGYTLDSAPFARFTKQAFKDAPRDAKLLGCSPDFNAWTNGINPPPKCVDDPLLRTASGHVHIGWTEGEDINDDRHISNCIDLIKQLDWFVGGWSVTQDPDPTRRKLYGRAGAHRRKDYGVEYRVLSNFWVLSAGMRREVWDRVNIAVKQMSKRFAPDLWSHGNDMLVEYINLSERKMTFEADWHYPILTASRY